jgi:hypothetical protein
MPFVNNLAKNYWSELAFAVSPPRPRDDNVVMIRIREIRDPDLRKQILDVLADRRGCSVAAIPDWFELDDADYVDLLNAIQRPEDEAEQPDFRE